MLHLTIARIASIGACGALLALPLESQSRYGSEINRTIVRAPDRPQDSATNTAVLESVTAAEKAVIHVFVEITERRNTFKIERPSTGVIVDPNGLVVTFWSLVQEAFENGKPRKNRQVRVHMRDGRNRDATLVAHNAKWDLAMLRIDRDDDAETFAFLELADTNRARPGDSAIVLSYHDGKEAVSFAGVVSRPIGATMHRGRELAPKNFLITDAAIQERSHGGAVIDARRRLIGLASSEHIQRRMREPTLEDILRPSYGFILPANRIRTCFAKSASDAANATLRTKPNAASKPQVAADAVARVAKSIVGVWGGDGARPSLGTKDPYATARRDGLGSGVVLTATGLIATNDHLLGGKTNARITTRDGKTYTARVVDRKMAINVALLQAEIPGGVSLQPIEIARAKDMIIGETVLGVGNPLGTGNLVVSIGVLSAQRGARYLQADPNLGNDNGGGALIDIRGRLLGIIDGGRIDKRVFAYRMRGDQAKLQSNLSLVTSVAALQSQFQQLAELETGEEDAAQRALRNSAVARVAEKTAKGLLNIYVSRSSRAKTDDDNPFAPAKVVTRTMSLGSGVVIDDSGLAISNWHVVDDATEPDGSMVRDHVVSARLRDGTLCKVEVLSISREDDLALLRLTVPDGRTIEAVELGDSDALRVGETAIAIGNPEGRANSVTCGIVSSKERSINIKRRWAKFNGLIETDAAINGGNSGGALLDLDGRLIGINSAGGGGNETTGFAIPVNYVRSKVTNLLLSPEKLRSAYVGMTWADDPKDDATQGALRVTAVAAHGPAKRAGIRVGDRLVSLDGDALRWSVDLTMRILERTGGTALRFAVVREGKRLEKVVTCLSPEAWACQRQLGVELEPVAASKENDLVRAAAIAMHRRYSNDPSATPSRIPDSLVRVKRTTKSEEPIQQGDLLLGTELVDEALGGALKRFESVRKVQQTINSTSTYEGRRFKFWIYRGGKVEVVEAMAKRLFL